MRGVRPGPVDGAGQLGPGLHDPQPRVPGSHIIYNHQLELIAFDIGSCTDLLPAKAK